MPKDEFKNFTLEQIRSFNSRLLIVKDFNKLTQKIVDTPFSSKLLTTSIDLGIIVLLLVNKQTDTIDRVALSRTELASGAVSVSAKPFNKIRIPLHETKNIISQAISENIYKITEDWANLFIPELTPEQARRNQRSASIESSLVYPLQITEGGALIYSFFQPKSYIENQHMLFIEKYSEIVSNNLTRLQINRFTN